MMTSSDDTVHALSSEEDKQAYNASVCAIRSVLASCTNDHVFIAEVLATLEKVFLDGGRHTFSKALKGWGRAVRSLMSRNFLDSSNIVFCKNSYNSLCAFRKAGISEPDIRYLVSNYEGICGFPPIILHQKLLKALLPNPSIDDIWRLAPLANIGRCAPVADEATNKESIDTFFRTTSMEWDWQFDFSNLSRQYGDLCRLPVPCSSRWHTSTHSSFDYTRAAGGKIADLRDNIIHNFVFEVIETIIPYRPVAPLYDILGNLVMDPSDWQQGCPIFQCLYKHLGDEPIDERLGLFGITWAILDLKKRDEDSIESSSEFFFCGYEIPSIDFYGTINCRISAVEEHGYKSRVITVAPLSVAILQVTLRHFIDPSLRKDPQVKIGLLSKVKLYDLMVLISGSRKGLDTYEYVSFTSTVCDSVDLTVATDSPQRESVDTTVRPYVEAVIPDGMQPFADLVLDIALSDRHFDDAPDLWYHRCGIMMGEAMSGVYLNVMSGIVRAVIVEFYLAFQDYVGVTSSDADIYIVNNIPQIQIWLNNFTLDSFGVRSSQSGDDVIIFNDFPRGELSRFLILLYRIMGLVPSESTFYSSEYMGTFTEEFCVKFPGSNGWIFIDIIKPRLFLPITTEGVDSLLSRIRQISNTLRYRRDDVSFVYEMIDAVDNLISSNVVLRDRISRYRLVKGFPAFLGGLDHPIQYEPGYFQSLDDADRELLCGIYGCTDEEFVQVKYSWAFDDIQDDSMNDYVSSGMSHMFHLFSELEVGNFQGDGNILPLHTYKEGNLLSRANFGSYGQFSLELKRLKNSLGLATLDDIITTVVSAIRFELLLCEEVGEDLNPLIKLRNRREFLDARLRGVETNVEEYTPFMLSDISWRFRTSFNELLVHKESFIECLGYNNLPSLSLPFCLTTGGQSE